MIIILCAFHPRTAVTTKPEIRIKANAREGANSCLFCSAAAPSKYVLDFKSLSSALFARTFFATFDPPKTKFKLRLRLRLRFN